LTKYLKGKLHLAPLSVVYITKTFSLVFRKSFISLTLLIDVHSPPLTYWSGTPVKQTIKYPFSKLNKLKAPIA